MSLQMQRHEQEIYEHRTMRQMVVEKLRQDITQGRLTPGQKLVYSDLAREINVSVTPVREAMKTLETLGLVTILPYRTAFVSFLTVDEIQQTYAVRIILEGFATREAVQRMSQEEFLHLKRLLNNMDREFTVLESSADDVTKSSSIVSIQRYHNEFHMSIYAISGNKYLYLCIELLRAHLSTYYPFITRYLVSRRRSAQDEHYAILTACEKRKPGLAEQLMQIHLEHSTKILASYEEKHRLSEVNTSLPQDVLPRSNSKRRQKASRTA